MNSLPLKTWEEFEETVSKFVMENNELRQSKDTHVSTPLFRGQACASWRLETTLDRMTGSEYALEDYHQVIRNVRPAVVSITGQSWEVPEYKAPSLNPVQGR